MILFKSLLILVLILSFLSLILLATIIIGVRYHGWEIHLAYKSGEDDEDDEDDEPVE